jgi:hypothetical protein
VNDEEETGSVDSVDLVWFLFCVGVIAGLLYALVKFVKWAWIN